VTRQLPKLEQVVHPVADLMGQGLCSKLNCPHLAGGGTNQAELQVKGNAVATSCKQKQL
jgi:hypothetical protein